VKRIAVLCGMAALCGCTVGPNYKRPTGAVINEPAANAPFDSGANAAFVTTPPPGAWWQVYQDPALDALVQQALAANTYLRVAAANISEAEAGLDLAEEAQYPSTSLEAAPSYTRLSPQEQLLPDVDIPPEFLYSLGGGLSYQVDLFGQIRRTVEASTANLGATRAAYDATRITVVAETTGAYVAACSAGREIAVAQQEVALQTRSTEFTQELFTLGRGNSLDVARATALQDQVRASIPPLEAEKREALYRLAVLTGRPPAEYPQSAASCDEEPQLNQPVPIGDGAELLARRPDVRRAEYELHAATAQIGIATASLYPQITFGASIESVGPTSAFLDYSSLKYSIGPLISWTFPNIRAAEDRIRGAKAGAQIAYAQFDGVVLNALRETESALTVYSHDLDQLALLQASRDQAAIAAADAQKLYSLGSENYLSVLDANLALISTDQAIAALDAKIAADQVTLFLALGGGWQMPDPKPHP